MQFRRDNEIGGAGAARRVLWIVVVTGRQFERGKNQKRAGLDAERLIGIAGARSAACAAAPCRAAGCSAAACRAAACCGPVKSIAGGIGRTAPGRFAAVSGWTSAGGLLIGSLIGRRRQDRARPRRGPWPDRLPAAAAAAERAAATTLAAAAPAPCRRSVSAGAIDAASDLEPWPCACACRALLESKPVSPAPKPVGLP